VVLFQIGREFGPRGEAAPGQRAGGQAQQDADGEARRQAEEPGGIRRSRIIAADGHDGRSDQESAWEDPNHEGIGHEPPATPKRPDFIAARAIPTAASQSQRRKAPPTQSKRHG
jgi:hypothetical protein